MNKVFESLKNVAKRDFNNGVLSGYVGYSKIKLKGILLTCECKKAAGSINKNHVRFNWFVNGKQIAFSELIDAL